MQDQAIRIDGAAGVLDCSRLLVLALLLGAGPRGVCWFDELAGELGDPEEVALALVDLQMLGLACRWGEVVFATPVAWRVRRVLVDVL